MVQSPVLLLPRPAHRRVGVPLAGVCPGEPLRYHHLRVVFRPLEASLSELLVGDGVLGWSGASGRGAEQGRGGSAGHVRVALLEIIFLQRPGAWLGPPEPVVRLPQSVALVLLLGGVREAGEGASFPPLAGLALTVTVVISEKVLAIHASDLLSGHDIPQYLDKKLNVVNIQVFKIP